MKFITLFTFQCVWSIAALAAASAAKPVSAPELREILASSRNIEKLQVPFHQTKFLKDMDLKIESDGQMTWIRPSHVTWEIQHPSPLTVELDQQQIRMTDHGHTQVLQADSGPAAQSLKGLMAWLNLDADALAHDNEVVETAPHVYVFKPKDPKSSPFVATEMTLSKQNQLLKLFMREASGDSMQIDFGKPTILQMTKPAK